MLHAAGPLSYDWRCVGPGYSMIYQAFEAQASMFDLMRPFAAAMSTTLRLPWPGIIPRVAASAAAKLETFATVRMTATRPAFRIEPVMVGNALVKVIEEEVVKTPFATLLRFRKQLSTPQPRVLVVAPMSGHFATLLRSTVQTLLIDHDVYITDWHNIRDVPLEAGPFDFSTYVHEVMRFLRVLGEGSHLVAVCQPTVPALAAAALLAEENDPAQPRSLTLMAGPIDARINPTAVNKLAMTKPITWFEEKLIDTVPPWFKGAGRRVYPGFVQLSAFISMNLERHKTAFEDMAKALIDGDLARHATIKSFYDEYLAVMDLSADFYIETVRDVFQEHVLPRGELKVAGRRVDPRAIRRVALLTIEGERDDICGLGQTMAAQDLCSSVRQYRKTHHVQTGVGHYGVFSGRRWVSEIYPKVRDTIAMAS
jgi:polyhydroxyalkanoate depolymerase